MKAILAAILLLATSSAWPAHPEPEVDDIGVTVEHHGTLFVIDVDLPLDVSPQEAWPTITDYDHMADFIPNISFSKVLSRHGNRLRVLQKGRARRGFISLAFENVRDVTLVPPSEIRTHLVSGNLKHAESVTRIVPDPRGARLLNHGEYTPAIWVPAFIARGLIASETREQFAQLRAEIMRRKARAVSLAR